jgi:hypothetical protein
MDANSHKPALASIPWAFICGFSHSKMEGDCREGVRSGQMERTDCEGGGRTSILKLWTAPAEWSGDGAFGMGNDGGKLLRVSHKKAVPPLRSVTAVQK